MHSKAYIFRQQQLLVDEYFQLLQVERLQHDLNLSGDGEVIVRDLKENEAVPEGYQLIPIRQLVQVWSRQQFEQASRAVQLLEWRRNHQFCSHCGHQTQQHVSQYAMVCPACGYIISTQESIHVSLPSLPAGQMKFYWRKMPAIKPRCTV